MSARSEYYLSAAPRIIEYETIEIAHSALISPVRVVRNKRPSLTATLETSASATFTWYPLTVRLSSVREDMDLAVSIDLNDAGNVIPGMVDDIRADDPTMAERPTLTVRSWRSDNLAEVLFGPLELQIVSLARKEEGVSLTAQAPRLNLNRTGMRYSIDQFPMLRSLL